MTPPKRIWGQNQKAAERCVLRLLNGRSERIRTSGPCLPKTVLYQAELHSGNGAQTMR